MHRYPFTSLNEHEWFVSSNCCGSDTSIFVHASILKAAGTSRGPVFAFFSCAYACGLPQSAEVNYRSKLSKQNIWDDEDSHDRTNLDTGKVLRWENTNSTSLIVRPVAISQNALFELSENFPHRTNPFGIRSRRRNWKLPIDQHQQGLSTSIMFRISIVFGNEWMPAVLSNCRNPGRQTTV